MCSRSHLVEYESPIDFIQQALLSPSFHLGEEEFSAERKSLSWSFPKSVIARKYEKGINPFVGGEAWGCLGGEAAEPIQVLYPANTLQFAYGYAVQAFP
jgi:hypothetical protein